MSQETSITLPAQVASPTSMSPISEAPASPLIAAVIPEFLQDIAATAESITAGGTETDPANTDPSKIENVRRQSTVKHQETSMDKEHPSTARRPNPARRSSSRYSQMTVDFFEKIPAQYNTLAG
jgi:hypothetical protein